MNALLLSAGVGERLMPLTLYRPKCLLPSTSEGTSLEFWIKLLVDSGIEKVFVNAYWLKYLIEAQVNKMEQKYKDHVCLHPMSELDPVEKVLFDLKDLLGEDFLVINSDTFIMKNKVIEFINSSKVDTGSVCLGVSMQDNVVGKSLIKVVDGRVEIFIEKPTTPSRGHSYSGIMLLNRDTVDISKDFMSEMIPSLVGKMSAIDVGEIVDIGGSIPAYLKACDHIREMEKI